MEPLGPYQILFVESDSSSAVLAERMLSGWGLMVTVAKDGKGAIELTKANTFDLILIDIKMPGMDGYETARIIRRLGDQFKSIPIIGHTHLHSNEEEKFDSEKDINDLILKPFNQPQLYDKLKNYLDKDRPNIVKANLDRCTDGDTEFRRELAQLLASNMSELLLSVEKALKLKDPTIFGRAVHKTKTTLSILGDGELMEELNIIQKKIGADTPQVDLEHHLQRLNTRCKKTINILNMLSTE